MAFHHRLPALSTGLLSSAAVLAAAFAGSSCRFLVFEHEEGVEDSFGVLCEHELFPRDGDTMWELSRIFLIVGLSLGSITAALAWAVASFLRPTSINWNGISVLAALTAVLQVPIFVLFEADPCFEAMDDDNATEDSFFYKTGETTCKLGPGSYMLMVSTLLYIGVTLITQCLDRPRWRLELDLWKVHKKGQSRQVASTPRNDEYYYDESENYDDHVRLTSRKASSANSGDEEDGYYVSYALPSKSDDPEPKKGLLTTLLRKASKSIDDREVPAVETRSLSEDDDGEDESVYLNPIQQPSVVPTIAHPSSVKTSEGQEMTIRSFEDVNLQKDSPSNNSIQDMPVYLRDFDGNQETRRVHSWAPTSSNTGPAILFSSSEIERHQMIESPDVSLISRENGPPIVPSSVDDILQDLHSEELGGPSSLQPPSPQRQSNLDSTDPASDAIIVEGVRKLKQKFKKDSKRHGKKISTKGLFQLGRKSGYSQILEYESDESYVVHDDQEDVDPNPSPELQMFQDLPSSAPDKSMDATANDAGNDDSEGEISLLASKQDWHDDFNGELDSEPTNPFDNLSIGSTHSDPGPIGNTTDDPFDVAHRIIGTGGETQSSLDDIFKFHSEDEESWDPEFPNESLLATTDEEDDSDDYDDDNDGSQGDQRGRSLGRPSRRRRAVSPVESIKSQCSLLHTRIDEETEEDVENELGLYDRYAIKRTLSCPEQRLPTAISTRKEKSTKELLKRLERLKQTIDVEMDPTSNTSEVERKNVASPRALNHSELPPRTPHTSSPSKILSPEEGPAKEETSYDQNVTDGDEIDENPSSTHHILVSKDTEASTRSPRKNFWTEPELPTKEEWKTTKDSPLKLPKETPGKKGWKNSIGLPDTPDTLNMSDDSSDTGYTRSTISECSDEEDDHSYASGSSETGPRRIRSKSMGRVRKHRKTIQHYRASSSLSPTRRSLSDRRKNSSSNLSSLARESRIRRLQQRRKKGGYLALDNDPFQLEMPSSPLRRYQDPFDNEDDVELTPKRKTALNTSLSKMDDKSEAKSDDISDGLFQPSLTDPDESCPEFDNILNQLDLQLIDLNRPIGAEYGDDEGSL